MTFSTAELPMYVQQRVFERRLYFYFVFRFAKIWSNTYQRNKEAQIIQFHFLLELNYLHANQAPDPYPSARVTQKMNIVNSQISKGLKYYALAKAHFFHNRVISTDLFLLQNFKLIVTHCLSGTWQAVIGRLVVAIFLAIITVSCGLHPGV